MLCLKTAFPFWHVIEDLSLQGCEQASCQCVAEAKYLKRSYLGTIVEQFFFILLLLLYVVFVCSMDITSVPFFLLFVLSDSHFYLSIMEDVLLLSYFVCIIRCRCYRATRQDHFLSNHDM